MKQTTINTPRRIIQRDTDLLHRAYLITVDVKTFDSTFLYSLCDRVQNGEPLTPGQRDGVKNVINGFGTKRGYKINL